MPPTANKEIIAARTLDLRAEFEAQLRAVVRIEEQLHKSRAGRDKDDRSLETVLRRELAEMQNNNLNIRDLLNQISAEVPVSTT